MSTSNAEVTIYDAYSGKNMTFKVKDIASGLEVLNQSGKIKEGKLANATGVTNGDIITIAKSITNNYDNQIAMAKKMNNEQMIKMTEETKKIEETLLADTLAHEYLHVLQNPPWWNKATKIDKIEQGAYELGSKVGTVFSNLP